MKKQYKIMIAIALFLIVALGTILSLFYFGVLLFNNPSEKNYPVRGIDVSAYQGEIDWNIISEQGIHFAYIKATEGSGHVDRCFQYNFENALKTDLRVGAYHFFSFDSSGRMQAANFISAVPKVDDMLPPVVDFEFYADKEKNLPDKDSSRQELSILLQELENYYEVKPVLYVTEKSYDLYISGYYSEYDIWIRNVLTTPKQLHGQPWVFWQYTNRERLDGYRGEEQYIDMNVFSGSAEEFQNYGK